MADELQDDLEDRLKAAIGNQGEEGDRQVERVLRMLTTGLALQRAARGGGTSLGPPLENDENA